MKTKWMLAASAVVSLTVAATVLADLPGPRWIKERNNELRMQGQARELQRRSVHKIFPFEIQADEKAEVARLQIPVNLVGDLRAGASPNIFPPVGLAAGLMCVCTGTALRWPRLRRPLTCVGTAAVVAAACWIAAAPDAATARPVPIERPRTPFTLNGQVAIESVAFGERIKLILPRSVLRQIPTPPPPPAPMLIPSSPATP